MCSDFVVWRIRKWFPPGVPSIEDIPIEYIIVFRDFNTAGLFPLQYWFPHYSLVNQWKIINRSLSDPRLIDFPLLQTWSFPGHCFSRFASFNCGIGGRITIVAVSLLDGILEVNETLVKIRFYYKKSNSSTLDQTFFSHCWCRYRSRIFFFSVTITTMDEFG